MIRKKMKKISVAILGDGGWGTTLAIVLSHKGYDVSLWGAFAGYSAQLSRTRVNSRFLPGVKIPAGIAITSDMREALEGRSIVVLAVPSEHMRRVLVALKPVTAGRKDLIFLSASKGIEVPTLRRMSEVVHEIAGSVHCAVLSGPTIAREVALGIPTVAVIASRSKKVRLFLQDVFTAGHFRIYTNDDVVGVELGGSLKNVIAIACGISDGLGFGTNTKAALLSRGLAEISRLGVAMGARRSTFSGISGLGDLVTTCISQFSRNRYVGEQIGKGRPVEKVLSGMQMVAEGVPTARSAHDLGKRYKIELPITREVYNVLYKSKSPVRALKDLMGRASRQE